MSVRRDILGMRERGAPVGDGGTGVGEITCVAADAGRCGCEFIRLIGSVG